MKRFHPITGIICLILFVAVVLVAWRPAASQTAVDNGTQQVASSSLLFSYQGQLLDAAGSPITDSAVGITFHIYTVASGGNPCWTEAHTGNNAVSVRSGIFQVLLGQFSAIDAACLQNDAFLELVINGETLSPREQFTSVVHAVKASDVDGVLTAQYGGGITQGGGSFSGRYYVGSLPYDSEGAFQKLFVTVWGGSWYNNTLGQDFYSIASRGGLKVTRTRLFGKTDNYEFHIYDTGSEYDIVIETDGTQYPSFVIRSQKMDHPDSISEQPIVKGYDPTGKTDVTPPIENHIVVDDLGNVSFSDHLLNDVRALRLKDWDDDSGGSDDKYRLLARDGAFTFYDGGVAIGRYPDGTWGDLANGNLIVQNNVGIGTTNPSRKLDVNGDIHAGGNFYMGGTDLTMEEVAGRGGGRALVNDAEDQLTINYGGDFTGGVRIWSNAYVHGELQVGQVCKINEQESTNYRRLSSEDELTCIPGSITSGAYIEANLMSPTEHQDQQSGSFEQGDLLCWDGNEQKLVLCTVANDRLVMAVASIDGKPIVLGAEPVKVLGPVTAGDILVASDTPGYAMVNNNPAPGTVIGQALENLDEESGFVKTMIRKW